MVSALVKKAEGVDTDKQTLVIGFAETATALGHLFTDHFRKAYYLTTTRENLGNSKCIDFIMVNLKTQSRMLATLAK